MFLALLIWVIVSPVLSMLLGLLHFFKNFNLSFIINTLIINIKRECISISIEGNLSCTSMFFLEGVPLNFYIKRGFDPRL